MTPRSRSGWTRRRGSSGSGEDGMPRIASRGCAIDRVVFPPERVAAVKAVACELPIRYGLPLSRFSRTELHRLVIELAVTGASASTIWRWLHDDALKPWQTRSWIYRRDPDFAEKAASVLDLYARVFDGKRLRPDEYVISADEKSQLQAPAASTRPARRRRVARSATSSSTSAAARSRTWPRGMCITPTCSIASSPRPGSSHSAASSSRS